MRGAKRKGRWRPWGVLAAACCVAWACSLQFAGQRHPSPSWYLSLGQGGAGLWYWSPAERSVLRIGSHQSLGASSGSFFFWKDAWGFGLGIKYWPIACGLVLIAVWRFAVAGVRGTAPAARRAHWRLALLTVTFSAATLMAFASARHRSGQVASLASYRLLIENGAVALQHGPPPPLPMTTLRTPVISKATASVRWNSTPSIPAALRALPPSRQGAWLIDFVPDLYLQPGYWRGAVPLWPLPLLLAWLAWRARRAAAFSGVGLCASCGYDLKGLANTAACPECGGQQTPSAPARLSD